MTTKKSASVSQAEIGASQGDLSSMELLARRFFDGRGVAQNHSMSYVWSTVATQLGVKNLDCLNKYSLKHMTTEQQASAIQEIQKVRGELPRVSGNYAL